MGTCFHNDLQQLETNFPPNKTANNRSQNRMCLLTFISSMIGNDQNNLSLRMIKDQRVILSHLISGLVNDRHKSRQEIVQMGTQCDLKTTGTMMDRKKISLKNAVWQIVAALTAHSIAIQAGINMAYSTILLPHITSVEEVGTNETNSEYQSELIVNKDEASWIASLVAIATPVGSLLTGSLMDRFGRKKICAFTTVPFVVSWILVATTTVSVYTIYVARILAGVGGGLSTAAIVYVSEISHPSIRPMLLSLTSVFVSFGILLTTLLAYFLNWKMVAVCCGALAFGSLVGILFIPESPAWIVGVRTTNDDPNKGFKKAERLLKWLYKNEEDYQNEYASLMKIKEQKSAARADLVFDKTDVTPQITLRSPQAWKPLVILYILLTLQQFSGGYIVIFYAVQIFEQSGSVEVDQFTSVVILGAVRFIMAILSTFLSKRYGRRPLLFSSGLGMGFSVLLAAGWIHFVDRGIVPVVCLLIYVLFASYGITVIPWTLIGELLPLSIRGKGSGFMVAVAYVHMFVTVKLFILIMDLIGIELVFVVFSVFSFALVVFGYFKVPETLGKTFQEIENHFK